VPESIPISNLIMNVSHKEILLTNWISFRVAVIFLSRSQQRSGVLGALIQTNLHDADFLPAPKECANTRCSPQCDSFLSLWLTMERDSLREVCQGHTENEAGDQREQARFVAGVDTVQDRGYTYASIEEK
jgi:hypothetical protein